MNRTLTYPTPIWSDNFKHIDNDQLIDLVLEQGETDKWDLSEISGWRTTKQDFINDERFKLLLSTIDEKIYEISLQYDLNEKYKLSKAQGWAYITEKGGWHPPHAHPEAFLSCVYYIKVPEDSNSNIVFDDPRDFMYDKSDLFKSNNELTHRRIPINPQEGDFIAFPGWFRHFVTPSMSDEKRIVVTLNYALEES